MFRFTHRLNFKLHSFDHRSSFFRFYFMVDRHLNIEYFCNVAYVCWWPTWLISFSTPWTVSLYSIPVLNELNLAQMCISHIMKPNKTFCWWIIPYLLRFRFNGIQIRRKVLCPLNDWCERIFQFSHENSLGIRPTSNRIRLFFHEGMGVERKLCRELRIIILLTMEWNGQCQWKHSFAFRSNIQNVFPVGPADSADPGH